MTDEQTQDVNEYNEDELIILLKSEEIKAKLSELGDEVSGLLHGVLGSVQAFLKRLG